MRKKSFSFIKWWLSVLSCLAYQLNSVVKLTHHETGLDWPIPINPCLLLGGQGAKGGPVQGLAWGVSRVSQLLSALL